MKKIFIVAFASIMAFASCARFEQDKKFDSIETGAPIITVEEGGVAENYIKATIAPADENTTWYSYALFEGYISASQINADYLLSDNYKDDAIASACVEAKDNPSVVVEADELESGYTYTLLAVATSASGTVSELASKVFILDDTQAPSVIESGVEYEEGEDGGMTIYIPFSRALELAENAAVTVSGWAIMDWSNLDEDGYFTAPEESFELPGENLAVKDNYLIVSVPSEKYQAGKLLSVTFGAGIVTSLPVSEGGSAGIANEAFADEGLHCEDGPDGGIWAQYENVPFELSVSETNPLIVLLAEWESAAFTVESANVVYGIEPDSIQAKYTLDGNGYTSERSAVCSYSLSGEGKLINVGLPVEPLENEVFEFTIPAGKVYDVYGNVNANEVSIAPADCVKQW